MPKEWTAELVARMHLAKVTKKQLAEEAGYTPEYVSMVLNGHRDTENAKSTLLAAANRLIDVNTSEVPTKEQQKEEI